jgi:hypothetical protein
MKHSPFRNKDVSVVETDRYIIVKIPRSGAKISRNERMSFADLAGVLQDIPAFKGKTSVEVQHIMKDLWIKRTPTSAHSL